MLSGGDRHPLGESRIDPIGSGEVTARNAASAAAAAAAAAARKNEPRPRPRTSHQEPAKKVRDRLLPKCNYSANNRAMLILVSC